MLIGVMVGDVFHSQTSHVGWLRETFFFVCLLLQTGLSLPTQVASTNLARKNGTMRYTTNLELQRIRSRESRGPLVSKAT